MGRPTKLTPELHDTIIKHIRAGNYIETACAGAGVHVSSYHIWRRKGLLDPPHTNPQYAKFVEAVDLARSEAEMRNVAIINRAAVLDPRQAQWWLERSHPHKWGRLERTELEVSGPNKQPIQVKDELKAELLKHLQGEDDTQPETTTP